MDFTRTLSDTTLLCIWGTLRRSYLSFYSEFLLVLVMLWTLFDQLLHRIKSCPKILEIKKNRRIVDCFHCTFCRIITKTRRKMTDLNTNKVLLLDGGLSNDLNNRVNFDVHKEPLWTAKAIATDRDAVIATHLAYLQAGADIIETASYQATLEGFKDFMSLDSDGAKKLIEDSAVLAKLAVDKFVASERFDEKTRCVPLIAGSIGPYGVYLCDGSEYSGSYMTSVTKSQIENMHLPRIISLVAGGADLLAIETMPCLEEVIIILDLVKAHSPSTKVWVSFSIKEGNPTQTAFGDSMEDAYKAVVRYAQVVAFGINCCAPSDVETFLQKANSCEADRKLKIIVYPNSGQKWLPSQGWINDPVPTLDTYLQSWISHGVNIVGGCCQVGVDQIKKMRSTIDLCNAKK